MLLISYSRLSADFRALRSQPGELKQPRPHLKEPACHIGEQKTLKYSEFDFLGNQKDCGLRYRLFCNSRRFAGRLALIRRLLK